MNTLKIKSEHIRGVIADLRRMKLKHLPFRKIGNVYEIDLYPNENFSLLQLKYCT
jgi:hypothetical protein